MEKNESLDDDRPERISSNNCYWRVISSLRRLHIRLENVYFFKYSLKN